MTPLWLLLLGCPLPEDTGTELCTAPPSYDFDDQGVSLLQDDCGEVRLVAEVHGTGELTLELDAQDAPVIRLTLTAGAEGAVFEGLTLRGPWSLPGDPAEPAWWRQGYQSWSWSGVTAFEEATLDEAGQPEVGGDGDGTDVRSEEPGTSWWVAVLGEHGGASIGLGALGSTRTRFHVAVTEDELIATWGLRGGTHELAPGEPLTLDPLWLQVGSDPAGLLADYADLTLEELGVPAVSSTPPTGWLSWYQYFTEIDEPTLLAELAEAAQTGVLEVFQVDDGWQVVWGDWTADEGFPSGMDGLAASIEAAGMRPGLWLAPLYVDRSTTTWQDHPDWWVVKADGEPITFTNLGTGDYALLDVTHPEAAAWLQAEIARLVAEGWTYLKLDFLYAGAQEGLRHEAINGTQAYVEALRLMREAAGEDTWLLASGAPVLSSVGWFDSFRSGADISFDAWPDPQAPFLRWAGRSTAARSWANGRWWWSDPDPVLIRDPFDEVQVTGALAAQVASGGAWFLGDSLLDLDAARLADATDPALLATRGQTVEVTDPLASVSGLDAGPLLELALPDDSAAPVHALADGTVVTMNLGEDTIDVPRPPGAPILGDAPGDGPTMSLAPGAGVVWESGR